MDQNTDPDEWVDPTTKRKEDLTRDDLGCWALKAERHLKAHLPRTYRRLVADGDLLEYLVEINAQVYNTIQELRKKGMSEYEAQSEAERMWIRLPEERG